MESKEIAKHLLNDVSAYEEFILEMIEKRLDADPVVKKSWEKWFLSLDPDINVDMPQPLNNTTHGN